jgi:hypothetical protein
MNSEKQPLFDFVVIGAPKCGTTYTYQLLKEHPEIAITSSKDGIQGGYFRNNTSEKTKKVIEKLSFDNEKKIAGEFREGYYMKSSILAPKIAEYNPGMKIIICARNPYERAYSAYKHISLLKNPTEDFLENEAAYNYILEKGYFYKHLKPFFDTFPSTQILFLDFEELKNNSSNYREKLYAFLGVNAEFIPSTEGKQLNDTRFKGTLVGRLIHNTLMPVIDRLGLGRAVRSSSVLRSLFYRLGNFVGKRARQKIDILSQEAFIKKIEGIYDEDLQKLKEEYNIEI